MKKYKIILKQYNAEFEVSSELKVDLIRNNETEVREYCTKNYKGYEITTLEAVKDSNGLDIWYPYDYITKVYTPTPKEETTQDVIDQLAKAGITACTIDDYLNLNVTPGRLNVPWQSKEELRRMELASVEVENYIGAAYYRDQIKALDEVTN